MNTHRILILAVLLRVGLFPFAENKLGDAPIRSLIAERMNAEPGLGLNPGEYQQFGPLHIAAMRPFLLMDPVPQRASRWLSLGAGIATLFPLVSLTRRLYGERAALFAAMAFAFSPLHVQASTTAGSEALYVLLLLASIERLSAAASAAKPVFGAYAVAGVLAGLAALTRYDAWIALPVTFVVAAWRAKDRRRLQCTMTFGITAFLFPLGWLIWMGLSSGHPLGFLDLISDFHAASAAEVIARMGPVWARLRQVGIWTLALAAAMTPACFLALRRSRHVSMPAMAGVVTATALAPIILYLFRGIVFATFEPLSRFALAPGVLLLPLAGACLEQRGIFPARLRAVVQGAAVWSLAALAVAHFGNGWISVGAEALSPLVRLKHEDRALARYLREHRQPGERVFIDTRDWIDLAVTHAAQIPSRESASVLITREPGITVQETSKRTGAVWIAFHDSSWGQRFGHVPGAARIFSWQVWNASRVAGVPDK